MEQHARVPKFGNWGSGGSVPYTQYFDIARKGRTAGKLINPNDPIENPEAFSEDLPPVRAPPFRTSSDDPDAPKPRAGNVVAQNPSSDSPHHQYGGDRGNPGDPQRRAGRISGRPDRSIEQSPLHPTYQAKSGSKGGVAPNTLGRTRMRTGGRGDGIPEKGSALPKFGEWEVSDPSRAESYTGIFNKEREERLNGMARVPAMSESSYPNGHPRESNYGSTGCSCFGWCKN